MDANFKRPIELMKELRHGDIRAYLINDENTLADEGWPHKRLSEVFSIKFGWEDVHESQFSRGLIGEKINEDYVLISTIYESDDKSYDEYYIDWWKSGPVGLVTREALFRSVALLLLHSQSTTTKNLFSHVRGEVIDGVVHGDGSGSYIETEDIDNGDLYRLLLAAYGFDGIKAIEYSDYAIKRFKHPDSFFTYPLLKKTVYTEEFLDKMNMRFAKRQNKLREKLKKIMLRELSNLPKLIKKYEENIPTEYLLELMEGKRPPLGNETNMLLINWFNQKDKFGTGYVGQYTSRGEGFLKWLTCDRQKKIIQSLKAISHPDAMKICRYLKAKGNELKKAPEPDYYGQWASYSRKQYNYNREFYVRFVDDEKVE